MTDRPDEDPHDVDPLTHPTETAAADRASAAGDAHASMAGPTPSRWDGVRPRGRLGQIAAILVATASAVFIAGAIFVAGFAVGSEGGGEHHGHGGDGYSHGDGDDHRDGESADGSGDGTAGGESGDESSHGDEEP